MPQKKLAKKNPFDAISEDWRAALESASETEVRAKISETALAEEENQDLKDQDQDLAAAKEQAKEAGAQYADATKINRLKIRYARQLLQSRGVQA